MNGIKSWLTVIGVSLNFIRAAKFDRLGKQDKVYELYVEALSRLKKKGVDRNYGMIRLLILTFTKALESLSVELKKTGASEEDIRHSLETLKGIPGVISPSEDEESKHWIKCFEERLKSFSTQL